MEVGPQRGLSAGGALGELQAGGRQREGWGLGGQGWEAQAGEVPRQQGTAGQGVFLDRGKGQGVWS